MPVIGNRARTLRRLLSLLAFAALLLASPLAWGACTTSSGTVDLGSVSSLTVADSQQLATGSTGFACTGSLLSLISTNTITATIASASNSSGTQPRLFDAATGDYIPYAICKDTSCSATYSVGSTITWSSTTFAGILGLFNASGGTLPLTIRTASGTQVAAGTYTSVITINWSWHLCAVGALGLCVYDDGTATSVVNVTMIVTPDCAIAAPQINFGTAALVGSLDPVTQSITIRCSKDAAYTVGIDNGLHASGGRRMENGGNYIAYDIYYPAGSASRWGPAGAERRGSDTATTNAGVYTGTTDQTFTYSAEILSGQTTPPAGTYTDTLTVDVAF